MLFYYSNDENQTVNGNIYKKKKKAVMKGTLKYINWRHRKRKDWEMKRPENRNFRKRQSESGEKIENDRKIYEERNRMMREQVPRGVMRAGDVETAWWSKKIWRAR